MAFRVIISIIKCWDSGPGRCCAGAASMGLNIPEVPRGQDFLGLREFNLLLAATFFPRENLSTKVLSQNNLGKTTAFSQNNFLRVVFWCFSGLMGLGRCHSYSRTLYQSTL